MYHNRLTYNLNKTPLQNTVALFNSKLKPGNIKLEEHSTLITKVSHLEETYLSNVTIEEYVDGIPVDTIDLQVVIPDMQVLINELRECMDLDYKHWDIKEVPERFITALIDASKLQGWDLSKQIKINGVSLGTNAQGDSEIRITQLIPFFKSDYVFVLPLAITTGIAVEVETSEVKISENF